MMTDAWNSSKAASLFSPRSRLISDHLLIKRTSRLSKLSAIVTTDLNAARRFTAAVDSSCVLVNASTRFNDGQELGLGAEIGISTDKFHARGPCGLVELTSYKYIVMGEGQVRGE